MIHRIPSNEAVSSTAKNGLLDGKVQRRGS
jgi:hypothetical protein